MLFNIKNYKLSFKNFINKKLKKLNIKNNILRFSPYPSCYIHIGHLKNIFLNIKISKVYNGKFTIRLDDTNIKIKKKYIKNTIKIINFLKKYLKFIKKKKTNFSSKNFNKLFQYIKFLKKKNNNLNKFKKGFFKKKKYIILFSNKNKKYIIYRIKYKKHINIKYNWFIYPLYNYSQAFLDKIEGIKYSICTLEFEKYKNFYKNLNNLIYKKLKPNQIESNKLLIKKNLTSKKKLIYLKIINFIKNFKDIRILTIKSFKFKNFNIKNIIYFLYNINFIKREKLLNFNFIKNYIFKNSNKIIKKNFYKNFLNIIIINKKNIKIFKNNNFIIKNILLINYKKIFNINNYLNFKNLILKSKGFFKNKIGLIKIILFLNFKKNIFFSIKKEYLINKNYIFKNKLITINNFLIKKNLNFKSIKIEKILTKNLIIKKIKSKKVFLNNKKKLIFIKNSKIYNLNLIPS